MPVQVAFSARINFGQVVKKTKKQTKEWEQDFLDRSRHVPREQRNYLRDANEILKQVTIQSIKAV